MTLVNTASFERWPKYFSQDPFYACGNTFPHVETWEGAVKAGQGDAGWNTRGEGSQLRGWGFSCRHECYFAPHVSSPGCLILKGTTYLTVYKHHYEMLQWKAWYQFIQCLTSLLRLPMKLLINSNCHRIFVHISYIYSLLAFTLTFYEINPFCM